MKRIMTLVLFVAGGSLVFAQDEGKKDEGKKGGQAPSPPFWMRGIGGPPTPVTGYRPLLETSYKVDKIPVTKFDSQAKRLDHVLGNDHLKELEDHWGGVEMRGQDDAGLAHFLHNLHPDFQLTTYDTKKFTRDSYVTALKLGDLSFELVKKRGMQVTRSLGGKVAVVTGQATVKGQRIDAGRRPELFSADILFTDVFIDVSDEAGVYGERRHWQCLSSSQTLSQDPSEHD